MAVRIVCPIHEEGVELTFGENLQTYGRPRCQRPDGEGYWENAWVTVEDPAGFDLSQIDPTVSMAMFVGGWSVFITPFIVAWGFKQLLDAIKRF